MGQFYTNITVKGPKQQVIGEAIAQLERYALVSPTCNQLTVVYDRDGENQDGSINDLAQHLSQHLRCVAFAVTNHDDSVLYYRLFKDGDLIDQYDSCPNYFDGPPVPPSGGNAEILCRAFDAEFNRAAVNQILHVDKLANDDDQTYVWEVDRHRELVSMLLLPAIAVGTGYGNFADGQFPEGLSEDDLYIIDDTSATDE